MIKLAMREDNIGSQTDVIKFEMVYEDGGIYVDIDSTALRPFDENFHTAFVSNIAHPSYNLCAGVFGMPKHSAFLGWMFDVLKSDAYLEKIYHSEELKVETVELQVSKRTGP